MDFESRDSMLAVKNRLLKALPSIGPSGLPDDIDMPDIPWTEYETTTSSGNKGKQAENEIEEIRLAVLEGEQWVEVEDYKAKVGDYGRDFLTVGWADEGEEFTVAQ